MSANIPPIKMVSNKGASRVQRLERWVCGLGIALSLVYLLLILHLVFG